MAEQERPTASYRLPDLEPARREGRFEVHYQIDADDGRANFVVGAPGQPVRYPDFAVADAVAFALVQSGRVRSAQVYVRKEVRTSHAEEGTDECDRSG